MVAFSCYNVKREPPNLRLKQSAGAERAQSGGGFNLAPPAAYAGRWPYSYAAPDEISGRLGAEGEGLACGAPVGDTGGIMSSTGGSTRWTGATWPGFRGTRSSARSDVAPGDPESPRRFPVNAAAGAGRAQPGHGFNLAPPAR